MFHVFGRPQAVIRRNPDAAYVTLTWESPSYLSAPIGPVYNRFPFFGKYQVEYIISIINICPSGSEFLYDLIVNEKG